MNDWSVTHQGETFRKSVLSVLTHEQFRATIGRFGMCFTAAAPRPVVRPAPDPARDARVAARRADDARRAGRALDALLGIDGAQMALNAYNSGWNAGYEAAQDEYGK
jgi:hypothetical protein